MPLGRHTSLPWALERDPDLLGEAAPYVIAVGDRRRVARTLARLDDALDLSDLCRSEIGERAAGRVELGIGRLRGTAVMAVETQMGGPATEIILREVLDRGARAVLRVGSCGTLARGGGGGGEVPALVVAEFATGWSAAVEQWKRGVLAPPIEPPHPPRLPCSPPVVAALRTAAPQAALAGVFSKDSLYSEQDERFASILRGLGCVATEMELATVGPVAESMGVAWGGIMATAGCVDSGAWYEPDATERNEDEAIAAALEAIAILAAADSRSAR